ncbi:hypothetical protein LXL04_021327 [Taraxacum kok-saghyz]
MKKKMMIATYTASATPTRLRLHQNINQTSEAKGLISLEIQKVSLYSKFRSGRFSLIWYLNSLSELEARNHKVRISHLLEIQKQEIRRSKFRSKFRRKSEGSNSGNQNLKIEEGNLQ